MSVLLDALKKAEQGKSSTEKWHTHQYLHERATRQWSGLLSVQEVLKHPAEPVLSSAIPDASSPFKPNPLPGERLDGPQRTAAHHVFSVKKTGRPHRMKQNLVWGVLMLIIAIAIGIWFWEQLQSLERRTLRIPAVPASKQQRKAVVPAQQQPTVQSTQTVPTQAHPATETPTPQSVADASIQPPARRALLRKPARSGAVDNPSPRSADHTKAIAPDIQKAYNALQAGNFEEAQIQYQRIVDDDPNNTDALLGLANLALRAGRQDQAERFYVQILKIDPQHAMAAAARVNLGGQYALESESRLKNLLAYQQGSSALHFALGNLYAAQKRWPEARQAYLQAHSIDPQHPDYLFNLAIAFEHLRLLSRALQCYQEALTAAKTRSHGFDTAALQARLLLLQQQLQKQAAEN